MTFAHHRCFCLLRPHQPLWRQVASAPPSFRTVTTSADSGGVEKKEGELQDDVSRVCPLSPATAAPRGRPHAKLQGGFVVGPFADHTHARLTHLPPLSSSQVCHARSRPLSGLVCLRVRRRQMGFFRDTHASYSFVFVCFLLQVRAPIVFVVAVCPCGAGG